MPARTDFRDFTKAIYAVVSAPPGARDWESIRRLYHPDARLVRTGVDASGTPFVLCMSFDDYVANVEEQLSGLRFSEIEIGHRVTIFGNVAELASSYAFRREEDDATTEGRGVNFLTLVCADERWQIMSIVWDNERGGITLPAALLAEAGGQVASARDRPLLPVPQRPCGPDDA